MARTVAQIKEQITNSFVGNATIAAAYGLTPGQSFAQQFSLVSLESLLFDFLAIAIWALEGIFDMHLAEVGQIIALMKPHRVQWYAMKAKLYQHGDSLVADTDAYPAVNLPARIVQYSAVTEVNKGLKVKVAKLAGGDLAPLSGAELTAFTAYMQEVKDAGVKLYISSNTADSLLLNLTIYYNPLVLSATGARLDGTSATPVGDAVVLFLKTQPFNGRFFIHRLIDVLQQVDGVVIPDVVAAQATYGTLPYNTIDVEYQPDAGYLRIITPADLTITYVPHEPI